MRINFKKKTRASGIEQGIEWATVNAPMWGAVNGYARIPEGHPWRGLGYSKIDVEVPGGLTYGDGEWVGFDTLHAGDVWPGMNHHVGLFGREDYDIQWTPDMVAGEARALARRIAEAAK